MAIKRYLEMLKQESSGVLGGWAPPKKADPTRVLEERKSSQQADEHLLPGDASLSPARTRKLLQQMVETRLEQLIQTRT